MENEFLYDANENVKNVNAANLLEFANCLKTYIPTQRIDVTGTVNPGGVTTLKPSTSGIPLTVTTSTMTDGDTLILGPRDIYCRNSSGAEKSFALNDTSSGTGKVNIGGKLFVNCNSAGNAVSGVGIGGAPDGSNTLKVHGNSIVTGVMHVSSYDATNSTSVVRKTELDAESTARQNGDTALQQIINNMDSSNTAAAGSYISSITQTDGKITSVGYGSDISGNAATATAFENSVVLHYGARFECSKLNENRYNYPDYYSRILLKGNEGSSPGLEMYEMIDMRLYSEIIQAMVVNRPNNPWNYGYVDVMSTNGALIFSPLNSKSGKRSFVTFVGTKLLRQLTINIEYMDPTDTSVVQSTENVLDTNSLDGENFMMLMEFSSIYGYNMTENIIKLKVFMHESVFDVYSFSSYSHIRICLTSSNVENSDAGKKIYPAFYSDYRCIEAD